ncbi:MAG: hypothetical protein K0U78_06040 [Actinomycetia bacterium]|nr:hypothetical protein [Actinomycetes bacterium]
MSRESVLREHGERTVDELDFIVQTLDELQAVVDRGKDAPVSDVLLQRAVEGCVNRIGDTIRNKIPSAVQEQYRGSRYWSEWVDWRVMLTHHYHRLDVNTLWIDLTQDVPEFRRLLVEHILS